jgi:hypothetical protein
MVQEVLSGPDKYSWLGHSVAMADVNGDQRDDVIAGAPRSDPEGRQDAGSLFFLLTQPNE